MGGLPPLHHGFVYASASWLTYDRIDAHYSKLTGLFATLQSKNSTRRTNNNRLKRRKQLFLKKNKKKGKTAATYEPLTQYEPSFLRLNLPEAYSFDDLRYFRAVYVLYMPSTYRLPFPKRHAYHHVFLSTMFGSSWRQTACFFCALRSERNIHLYVHLAYRWENEPLNEKKNRLECDDISHSRRACMAIVITKKSKNKPNTTNPTTTRNNQKSGYDEACYRSGHTASFCVIRTISVPIPNRCESLNEFLTPSIFSWGHDREGAVGKEKKARLDFITSLIFFLFNFYFSFVLFYFTLPFHSFFRPFPVLFTPGSAAFKHLQQHSSNNKNFPQNLRFRRNMPLTFVSGAVDPLPHSAVSEWHISPNPNMHSPYAATSPPLPSLFFFLSMQLPIRDQHRCLPIHNERTCDVQLLSRSFFNYIFVYIHLF
eukprot:gene4108-2954_t